MSETGLAGELRALKPGCIKSTPGFRRNSENRPSRSELILL
jgi:hypothetical protein